MADAWTVEWHGIDLADEGRREALCTLGNGRFATRGAAPESVADSAHYPGTYAAGCYNRLSDEIAGVTIENESLVDLPHWADLRFAIEDGEWIELSAQNVVEHRVALDLRRGLLIRVVRFDDPRGRRTTMRQRRFVHMAQPYLAGLHTVFTAENWDGRLRIASGLDGRVANAGVERYRDLAGRHLEPIGTGHPAPGTVFLAARTIRSQVLVAEAARVVVEPGSGTGSPAPRLREASESVCLEFEPELRRGEPLAVEKIVSLVTSRDPAVAEPTAAAVCALAEAPTFDELLETHELAWHHVWQRFRLDLTDGEEATTDETLRSLRLNLFHVLQTLTEHNLDLDAGIPARGLHGEAYRGHVFWDELFVFPLLTLRLPGSPGRCCATARADCRAARWAARLRATAARCTRGRPAATAGEESQRSTSTRAPAAGCRTTSTCNAMSAWRSPTTSGSTTRPPATWRSSPTMGRRCCSRSRASSQASRRTMRPHRYRIRGSWARTSTTTRYPGAATPGLDNNAYTNVMAVWLLRRALRRARRCCRSTRRDELVERLGIDPGRAHCAGAMSRDGCTSPSRGTGSSASSRATGISRSWTGTTTGAVRRHPTTGPHPGGRGPLGGRVPGLDALWFNPHWPRRFGRLEFSLQYRGRPMDVVVSGREVQVSAVPGPTGPSGSGVVSAC